MSVKFTGKKTFPLEYCIKDGPKVAVLFDSYAVNEAYDVVAGDPEKWMSGEQWDNLTVSCARFVERNIAGEDIPERLRLSSDVLKTIIQDSAHAH